MTLTADFVEVATTGGVYVAPDGTALPANANAARNVAFEEVGYISEDGVVQSIGSDRTDIKAWQNGDIVRKVQTSHDLTYQFTMLETNDVSLEVYYGNYTAGTVEINSDVLPHQRWVLEFFDGDDHIRVVIPDGEVTERGDVSYKNDEATAYPITITCYPDASGNKAYLYRAEDS